MTPPLEPHLSSSLLDFRPLPFLSNPHLQTVLGTLLPGPPFPRVSRTRTVALPDGDRLVLHDTAPAGWRPGGRAALLVHGLGGTHRSGYMGRLASLLLPHGFRVFRMDLRGCGRGLGLARRSYHGGCSDDVRAAAAEVTRLCPGSPLTLVGVSLGGNIVLKLAGEAAEQPVPGLERVAALAPPVDLVRCAELLAEPRNRFYERRFVRDLVDLVRRRQAFYPDPHVPRFPRNLTLRAFDDSYTAPRWQFADALDYYRRCSALPLLPRVAVPTFILTARDDPFIAAESFDGLRLPAHVQAHVLPRGGHIGFLGPDGVGGFRWAERRLADWVVRRPPTEGRSP